MKKSILLLVTFAMCVACSKKQIKSTEMPDFTTDFSNRAISEAGLNEQGCYFKEAGFHQNLICADVPSVDVQYQQRIEIVKYLFASRKVMSLTGAESDRVVPNSPTVRMIYDKSEAATKRLTKAPSLSKLHSVEMESDPQKSIYIETLDFLVDIARITGAIVRTDNSQVSIDCSRCESKANANNFEWLESFERIMARFARTHNVEKYEFTTQSLAAIKAAWSKP